MSRCTATKTDGERCRAQGVRDTKPSRCFWHNDRQAAKAASARGGRRRTIELPERSPLTPIRARRILAAVAEALLVGSLDAEVARAAAYIIQVDCAIREGTTVERRLLALEKQAAKERGRRR